MAENWTQKQDWYNDMLGNTREGFVSGHVSFSRKLNIRDDETAALRFIRRAETLLILLTIETDDVSVFNHRVLENHQLDKLKTLFGNHFHVLVFDKGDHFLLSTPANWTLTAHSSIQLEDFMAGLDPELVKNKGVFKEINRTVNDAFQIWTRTKLTRNCVVNDIDALLIGNQVKTICELKRVKASLNDWKPYLNDYQNYAAFLHIAKAFGLQSRTIAYQADNQDQVAFHFNLKLAPDGSQISGQYFLVEPKYTQFAQLGLIYNSTNSLSR